MSSKDRYDQQLKNLVNALSRSIIEATDEEILEDARLSGKDLDAQAAQLKQMFTDTAKTFQKRKLIQAQETYGKEVQILQSRAYHLPISPSEQRALLQLVAAQQTQGGATFTAKFRDLESLSDADVVSLLEELAALGLVPEAGPTE
jgi:hypothetical protein